MQLSVGSQVTDKYCIQILNAKSIADEELFIVKQVKDYIQNTTYQNLKLSITVFLETLIQIYTEFSSLNNFVTKDFYK